MGQPGRLKACHPMHIGGERGELKHLSTNKKATYLQEEVRDKNMVKQ